MPQAIWILFLTGMALFVCGLLLGTLGDQPILNSLTWAGNGAITVAVVSCSAIKAGSWQEASALARWFIVVVGSYSAAYSFSHLL